MKISCVRILKFDAAHRVVNHESKCSTIHGHEYKAEIFAESQNLDWIGRVIDFSVIKELVGHWIDVHWDHNIIIYDKDPNLPFIQACEGAKKPFISDFNPTAENMASYLLKKSNQLLLFKGVKVTKIKLWETQNCFVEVSNDKTQ